MLLDLIEAYRVSPIDNDACFPIHHWTRLPLVLCELIHSYRTNWVFNDGMPWTSTSRKFIDAARCFVSRPRNDENNDQSFTTLTTSYMMNVVERARLPWMCYGESVILSMMSSTRREHVTELSAAFAQLQLHSDPDPSSQQRKVWRFLTDAFVAAVWHHSEPSWSFAK